MEVLKRSNGATRAPPVRIALDPSLSLSFQLPASMKPSQNKPLATNATHPTLPIASATNQQIEKFEEYEDEDDSWETRDWSKPTTSTESLPFRRVIDTSMALHTPDEFAAWEEDADADAWEADAPVLPDDFPLLIVNLSRLRDLHFRSDSDGAAAPMIAMDTDDALRAFYATVKHTLYAHFTPMTEVLFDQEVCFHTHYGAQRRVLENLHRAYPTDIFAMIDYPPSLNGLDLHEYLDVLTAPTQWPSLNYLKDCLCKCSRGLEWKFEIALELEKLATQEHDWWTREQQRRSDEIDTLTTLRDSFRDKLRSLSSDQGGSKKTTAKGSEVMLLRKLEDLETRLVTLIDVYLEAPELTKREKRELVRVGTVDATPSMQMRNVVDMVVAMIFSRLPRDYGLQPTHEAHFDMLMDHHVHIRRLWKKDFGRLPVRTRMEGEDGEDEESEEEEEEEPVSDAVEEKDVVDEQDEANTDDWEAIADDGEEAEDDTQEEDEEIAEVAGVNDGVKPRVDVLDGYGADYDSDESDSDAGDHQADAEDEATFPRLPVTAKRVGRRTRRTKPTRGAESNSFGRDQSSIPVDDALVSQSERDRMLEAFMYGGGGEDSDSDSGGELLQSYARTGALQLLRRAKENEGF